MQKGEIIGLQKGEEIGLQKGKELGKHEEKVDTALKMKALGIEAEVIAQVTGLTADEIAGL